MASISIRADGQPGFDGPPDTPRPWTEFPSVRTGQVLKLDLDLAPGSPSSGTSVFASFPPLRDRVMLRDDGQSGDARASDGRFHGTVQVPSPLPDPAHLVFDVVSDDTLIDPDSADCESVLIGVPLTTSTSGGNP